MITIIGLFEDSVKKYPENPCLLEKTQDKFNSSSYNQVRLRVHQFAAGLLSLGIKKGDRISLLSEGRNDWVISELGILYIGAVNVPLSVMISEPVELKFRIEHSGSKMIIVSKNQYNKIEDIRKQLPDLEKVIILDAIEKKDKNDLLFTEIIEKGQEYLRTNQSAFEKLYQSIKGNDYANICYTSGTTADPKGIILTHRNYTANVEQSNSLFKCEEWFTSLIFLPWDHSFAHTCGIYTLIKNGASLASVQVGKTAMETLKNIPINIKETKPVFLLSVPAIAKNFKKNIINAIHDKGTVIKGLFKAGLAISYLYNGVGFNRGKGIKIFLWPMVKLFDLVIFKKIRENFGGRLEFFVGGGALLDIDIQKFFYAIGIPMFQGYGLSEASPVISSNVYKKHKMGTSGIIAENIELKICDEDGKVLSSGEKGEIVIRGENVMAGYWKNEQASAESLKNEWLYTGDLGYLDNDGFLYVMGRFKSLLIADDGEKYSPEGIEEAIPEHSKFIEQCMLYNNQKPYTVILVYPNKEVIQTWCKSRNIDIHTVDGKQNVLALLDSEIKVYRKGGRFENMFPQRWLPSSIGILEEGFTKENHLLNSTLKMVRGKIMDKYQDLIDFLYTPEAKNINNKRNKELMEKLFEK